MSKNNRLYDLVGFSIDNFRVFGKKTAFKLAPLTILTGTNSSGKSSFTKALHLLKRSYLKNGLFKLDLMDSGLKLGGYESIRNFNSGREEISFECEMVESSNRDKIYKLILVFTMEGIRSLKLFQNGDDLLMNYEIKVSADRNWNFLYTEKTFLQLPASIINEEKLKLLFAGLPDIELRAVIDSIHNYLQNESDAHTNKDDYYDMHFEYQKYDILTGAFNKIIDGLRELGKIGMIKRGFYDSETQTEVEYDHPLILSANPVFGQIIPSSVAEITDASILNMSICEYLNLELMDSFDPFPLNLFESVFKRAEFIDGVRATQELVYTKERSPEIFELLQEAGNIEGEYLARLTNWLINIFKLIKVPKGEAPDGFFRVIPIEGYGYMIKMGQHNQALGLAGLGYGVTQLLPILLKVALNNGQLFVIEEPESNLHPALQSKLADFFADAIDSPYYANRPAFIIETHSEYLVRKLQYLVAKKVIPKEDVQIYYFNDPASITHEEQIIDIQINGDGSLNSDFGTGFFDEADNIALDLFLLNRTQKN